MKRVDLNRIGTVLLQRYGLTLSEEPRIVIEPNTPSALFRPLVASVLSSAQVSHATRLQIRRTYKPANMPTIRRKPEVIMKAKEIMTANVECISPETGIQQAAQKMKSLDVGFLPVCQNDRLVGTVTDRDMVLRVVAEGKDVKNCKCAEVMSHDVFWCYEDQTSDEVADFMAAKEIRRALILNADKRLVGVISIGDLAKASGEEKKAGEALKEIAEAPPAQAA